MAALAENRRCADWTRSGRRARIGRTVGHRAGRRDGHAAAFALIGGRHDLDVPGIAAHGVAIERRVRHQVDPTRLISLCYAKGYMERMKKNVSPKNDIFQGFAPRLCEPGRVRRASPRIIFCFDRRRSLRTKMLVISRICPCLAVSPSASRPSSCLPRTRAAGPTIAVVAPADRTFAILGEQIRAGAQLAGCKRTEAEARRNRRDLRRAWRRSDCQQHPFGGRGRRHRLPLHRGPAGGAAGARRGRHPGHHAVGPLRRADGRRAEAALAALPARAGAGMEAQKAGRRDRDQLGGRALRPDRRRHHPCARTGRGDPR